MEPKFSILEEKVNSFLEAKTSISIISNILKKSEKSIYNTIQRINKKKNNKTILNKVKKGRVSKLSLRDKRVINRDLTRSPKKENKRLLIENSLGVTKRSLQRFLKEEGYNINISKKKPYLNKKKADIRLKDSKIKKKDKTIKLEKIAFSDKTAI